MRLWQNRVSPRIRCDFKPHVQRRFLAFVSDLKQLELREWLQKIRADYSRQVEERKNFGIITTESDLKEFSLALTNAPHVAIDSEFISFPWFRPKPELLQLATEKSIACIDLQAFMHKQNPRSPDRDKFKFKSALTNFIKKLCNSDKEIILHDARMDLNILDQIGGRPNHVWDTQISASFLGLGERIGLSNLIEETTGVKLLKTSTLSDWSHRPLTTNQLLYCFDDIRHLLQIRNRIHARLKELNRLEWYTTEMKRLMSTDAYSGLPIKPRDAWLSVRRAHKLDARGKFVLKEVAAWRQEAAALLNRTPFLLLRDDSMVSICAALPPTAEEYRLIQGIKPAFMDYNAEDVKRRIDVALKRWNAKPELVKETKALEEVSIADQVEDTADEEVTSDLAQPTEVDISAVDWLSLEIEPRSQCQILFDLFKSVVLSVGIKECLAPMILAPDSHLRMLAMYAVLTPDQIASLPQAILPKSELIMFKGWRQDVIGSHLLTVLEGRPMEWLPSYRRLTIKDVHSLRSG